MRVLYSWSHADYKKRGLRSEQLIRLPLLAPLDWNNPDHYDVANSTVIYAVTANPEDIIKIIIPKIRDLQHKRLVQRDAYNSQGMPFLIDQDVKCIQRINRLPWQENHGLCVTLDPFVRMQDTIIHDLNILKVLPVTRKEIAIAIR